MTFEKLEASLREQLAVIVRLKDTFVPKPFHFNGSEDIILKHGSVFRRNISVDAAKMRMEPRKCFANATMLAMSSPDNFAYCEGYAVSESVGLAIHHAWVIGKTSGLVLDPTWPVDDEVDCYMGVPLDLDYVQTVRNLRKDDDGSFYMALFEAPNLEHFCRNGIDENAIIKV